MKIPFKYGKLELTGPCIVVQINIKLISDSFFCYVSYHHSSLNFSINLELLTSNCYFIRKIPELAMCNWSHFEKDIQKISFIAQGGQFSQQSTFEIISPHQCCCSGHCHQFRRYTDTSLPK